MLHTAHWAGVSPTALPSMPAVPEGTAELRECCADTFGASLVLCQAMVARFSPLSLSTGYWEPRAAVRAAGGELWRDEAFVDLGWFDVDLETSEQRE